MPGDPINLYDYEERAQHVLPHDLGFYRRRLERRIDHSAEPLGL